MGNIWREPLRKHWKTRATHLETFTNATREQQTPIEKHHCDTIWISLKNQNPSQENIIGKPWGNHWDVIGKPWESRRETIGNEL
jgi:hypothetical protein